MYVFFKFKTSEDEAVCRYRIAQLTKKLKSRLNVAFEVRYEKNDKNKCLCSFNVNSKKDFEKMSISLPIYVEKCCYDLKSMAGDVLSGKKICANNEVDLNEYICGYVKKEEVDRYGVSDFDYRMENYISKSQKPFKIGINNCKNAVYKVKEEILNLYGEAYYPIAFSLHPHDLNLKHGNIKSEDFMFAIKHFYAVFGFMMNKMFEGKGKQFYLQSNIMGECVDVSIEKASFNVFEEEGKQEDNNIRTNV